MGEGSQDYQSAHEIGKVYNALLEKKLLCDFFVESVLLFIKADQSFLFISEKAESPWLISKCPLDAEILPEIEERARIHYEKGQPVLAGHVIYIPLIVRNHPIGVSCFSRNASEKPFHKKDLVLAYDLASQMASALKNILLIEQNIKMARLAAVGETVSMVLHEMKNIVQLATFSMEFLELGVKKKKSELSNRGLVSMHRAMRHMNGFVYELLSLTKDYKIVPKKVDLKKMLAELEEDLGEKAKQRKTRLQFQMDESFPEIEAEYQSLYRAVLNIVKNAIEAGDKTDAYVLVRVTSLGDERYQIVVEDNGSGMKAETKAKLFQSFFSTKGEQGTGLGLMILDKTIRAHYGKIQVSSEWGKGTTFSIALPKTIPQD